MSNRGVEFGDSKPRKRIDWAEVVEEIYKSSKSEIRGITIMSASNLLSLCKRECEDNAQPWDLDLLRQELIVNNNCNKLCIEGLALPIKGKKPVLGVSQFQSGVVDTVYDVDINKYMCDALVENPKIPGMMMEVLVKLIPIRLKNNNNIIISQGLSDSLGIKNGNVRIVDIYPRAPEKFHLGK